MNDREGDLIFHVDSTLSQEKRDNLQTALLAWSQAVKNTITGAELKNQNTSENTSTEFPTFHWTYFAKYGQSVSDSTGVVFEGDLTINRG